MINSDYKYTSVFSNINEFSPISGSTYIYGYSTEARSHIVDALKPKHGDVVTFVEIESIDRDLIMDKSSGVDYNLRSSNSIRTFLKSYKYHTLYLDVTGLNNRICASLLNNSMKLIFEEKLDFNIRIVYAEPQTYKIKQFKTEGVFNDLSEKIEGIEPLPGFANIIPDDVDMKFIALLGFEGGRFTHLIENIQPPIDNIIPIIGVPGYRLEYPFVAFWGNRRPLKETESWSNVRYSAANSLVDIYLLLSKILKESPKSKIKLAPIGTKPHAIGAMLFAIKYPYNVELVYDNPKRETVRTDGVGLIVDCCVSKLLNEN